MIARILVIAGSDSGGGAGIQADVRTITMLGGHPMTAITALTAQNTLGVTGVHPVPAAFVLEQVRAVADDIGVDAVKIGMIGSAETAHGVADWLEGAPPVPVVFDPVMIATSGSVLADADTIAAFGRLMRVATLTTPIAPELDALGGAAAVLATGTALLTKGGHNAGDLVEDRLLTAQGPAATWSHPRLHTRHTHGTGCTLSSAIATGLGAGLDLPAAVGRAVRFTQEALAHGPGLGSGHGPLGHALGTVPFDRIAPDA
jgi:hydroxymethylpyrimidine/phosphomethylpyrimidine kinase